MHVITARDVCCNWFQCNRIKKDQSSMRTVNQSALAQRCFLVASHSLCRPLADAAWPLADLAHLYQEKKPLVPRVIDNSILFINAEGITLTEINKSIYSTSVSVLENISELEFIFYSKTGDLWDIFHGISLESIAKL